MSSRKSLAVLGWIMVIGGMACAQPRESRNRRGGKGAGDVAQETLAAHNALRARMKLSPFQWSASLAAVSKKWADTLLSQNRFAHNPKSRYGENLFMIRGGAATPAMVVEDWASESRDYDYRRNSCRGTCGHYTQLVWRRTRSVGCGVARGRGREIWVCSYDPPGNVVGQRPY